MYEGFDGRQNALIDVDDWLQNQGSSGINKTLHGTAVTICLHGVLESHPDASP